MNKEVVINTIKLGRAYMHKKGIEVVTQDFVKIKVMGEWVDGVSYKEGGVDTYCRTLDDFISSFVLIK